MDADSVELLRELRERDEEERLRRLERRDLVRERKIANMSAVVRRAEKALYVGVGMISLRVLQEGGIELLGGLLTLFTGG